MPAAHSSPPASAAPHPPAITSPLGWQADGADLALVQVEVVDAQGRRNPVALDTVTFDLNGPAEWRGGIAQGGDNNHVLAKALPLEGGVNRVLVRSASRAGKIVLNARAAGLGPARLVLSSQQVEIEGGLSTRLPGAGLPLHLERGPPPSTPSFTVSRVALPVTQVLADSNQADAAMAVDDDETTRWASKPGEGSPSITFKLARRVPLTEVTLELSGWRERSYPLQVFVDGKQVYSGVTPRSLGYVTLPLAENNGGDVRIALNGVADESKQIQLTQVANQSIADTGASQTPQGVLSLVEAEFYQKPDAHQ